MNDNNSPQNRLQIISSKKNYNLSKIPKVFHQLLSFMDSNIRKQFRSFSLLAICGASDKARFIIDPNLQKSFTQLTIKQKLDLYEKAVNYGDQMLNSKRDKNEVEEQIQQQVKQILLNDKKQFYITTHEGFRSSQQIKIIIQGFKFNSKKHFNIDLQNYIFRKSKRKNPQCYVLEAINSSKPETLRFSFANFEEQSENVKIIQEIVFLAFKNTIKNMAMPTKITELGNKIESPKNSNRSFGRLRLTQKEIQQLPVKSYPIIDVNYCRNILQFSHSLAEKKNKSKFDPNRNENQEILAGLLKRKTSIEYDNQNKQEGETKANLFNQVLQSQNFIKQKLNNNINSAKQTNNTSIFRFKNIFEHVLPEFSLRQMENLRIFQKQIWRSNNGQLSIYQHLNKKSRFKAILNLTSKKTSEEIYNLLINAQLIKRWNDEVDESQIKITLTTDNCLICYQKHKCINNWYKQRDYLYLRHAFTYKGQLYFCDKSIQHSSFIPFHSIQRGFIQHQVTKIKSYSNNKIKITIDIDVEHEGFLGIEKKKELTLRYLQGYENLQQFCDLANKNDLQSYYKTDWNIDWIDNISSNRSNVQLKTEQFEEGSVIDNNCIMIQNQQSIAEDFFSVDDNENYSQIQSNNQINQMEKNQFKEQKKQIEKIQRIHTQQPQINEVELDAQGYCVLSSKNIQKKHQIYPSKPKQQKRIKHYDNIVLKDDFVIDKEAGIKLVNKKKIQAQDNVFSFIMKTMKKNLFSGKSILSISLPVQIFKEDSNTQRLCQSMSLGPLFLQKAAQSIFPLERMKYAVVFGLSNSILYFFIEKPFNPILGQTYQGIINGSLVYAEQISHHPPITSLYLVGRGYKVHASIQSKVFLHLNSGDGINAGYYVIQFEDGQVIKFQTAPGELSGFTIGDRKYRYKDTMYVIDQKNCLYSELLFEEPNLGMFSKKTWKYPDQIGGEISKVTQEFITKFMNSSEKIHPKPKQIQETLSKIDGRWMYYLNFDEKQYYNIVQDIPYQMHNYKYALNSDARFRQDLIYRTKNDLVKSQIHKEYLQNKQRKDRKLREQYTGKSH